MRGTFFDGRSVRQRLEAKGIKVGKDLPILLNGHGWPSSSRYSHAGFETGVDPRTCWSFCTSSRSWTRWIKALRPEALGIELSILNVRRSDAQGLLAIVLEEPFEVERPNPVLVIHDSIQDEGYVHTRPSTLGQLGHPSRKPRLEDPVQTRTRQRRQHSLCTDKELLRRRQNVHIHIHTHLSTDQIGPHDGARTAPVNDIQGIGETETGNRRRHARPNGSTHATPFEAQCETSIVGPMTGDGLFTKALGHELENIVGQEFVDGAIGGIEAELGVMVGNLVVVDLSTEVVDVCQDSVLGEWLTIRFRECRLDC